MDLGTLGISEEQVELMDVAEGVCRDLSPMDSVRGLLTDTLGHKAADWKQLGELGWLGIAIPESYGGIGLAMSEVVPVAEQMGQRLMGGPFVATTLAAQAILVGGTEAQKAATLPHIAGGQAATLALFELNGSVDLDAIETIATRSGDGFVLTGQKIFVQNLDVAKSVIVSAKLNGTTALFLLSTDLMSAEAMRRETIIDETKRTYALTFEGLKIPATSLMDQDKMPAALDHIHLCANLMSAAEMVGATKACIEYTVDYLKTRKQFGKLIGSYQALKHPTVDAYVGYEKSRSLLYAAAHSFGRQGEGEVAVRMAKVASINALSFAADRSIQFHGGFGFTYDCDAQLYRRRAIFLASQYGDVRYHKGKLAQLLFN